MPESFTGEKFLIIDSKVSGAADAGYFVQCLIYFMQSVSEQDQLPVLKQVEMVAIGNDRVKQETTPHFTWERIGQTDQYATQGTFDELELPFQPSAGTRGRKTVSVSSIPEEYQHLVDRLNNYRMKEGKEPLFR